MKHVIVIVDNGTRHLRALKRLLRENQVRVVPFGADITRASRGADLVVLSGGSRAPVIGNERRYRRELNFIRSASIPIIGICLGFELIARAYGAALKRLPKPERGFLTILPHRRNHLFTRRAYRVAERHRWIVRRVRPPLVALARSRDGIEALKHRTHPLFGFQFHQELLVKRQEGDELFRRIFRYALRRSP